MEKVLGKLEEIHKELRFQTKLLELQIDLIQTRQSDASQNKKDISTMLEGVIGMVKGSPYEAMLKATLSKMGG